MTSENDQLSCFVSWVSSFKNKTLCVIRTCVLCILDVFDLVLPKKKIKEEKRKKKIRPIKTESEEVGDVQMSAASVNPAVADTPAALAQSVKEE